MDRAPDARGREREQGGGKRKRSRQRFGDAPNRHTPGRARRVVDGDEAQPREPQPERVVGDQQPGRPHALRRHDGAGGGHDGADAGKHHERRTRATRKLDWTGRFELHWRLRPGQRIAHVQDRFPAIVARNLCGVRRHAACPFVRIWKIWRRPSPSCARRRQRRRRRESVLDDEPVALAGRSVARLAERLKATAPRATAARRRPGTG